MPKSFNPLTNFFSLGLAFNSQLLLQSDDLEVTQGDAKAIDFIIEKVLSLVRVISNKHFLCYKCRENADK